MLIDHTHRAGIPKLGYAQSRREYAKYKCDNFFYLHIFKQYIYIFQRGYTIVEDFILPAAVDMAGTMMVEKVKETI